MSLRDATIDTHALERSFLETLEGLVGLESPTSEVAAVQRLVDHLDDRLTHDGWRVERHPRPGTADVLVATVGGTAPGPATLLLAHCDTVWALGTTAMRPWRRDGDEAYGPGILDMKAGIAMALHATHLARAHGTLPGRLTLLVNADEETGSVASRPLIEAEARRHDRVLVLEPAARDGGLIAARKGAGDYDVTFTGTSAHSGEAYDDGASALRELAHFLLAAEALTDRAAGTTVAVTVARAGTVSNVIPGEAWARVDLRIERAEEAGRIDAALRAYRPVDARITVRVEGSTKRPPMVADEASRRLCDHVRSLAARSGLDVPLSRSGGGSDANFTSALGVPTLDGLGAVGEGAHAIDERISVPRTLERLTLLAAVLAEAGG
jgi:glutamate carboxypeptidase